MEEQINLDGLSTCFCRLKLSKQLLFHKTCNGISLENLCGITDNHSFVHLLMGYHLNVDNKFIDDFKTSMSFEGKNGTKIEYKKVFRQVCLDSCTIKNTTTYIHHQVRSLVESYFLLRTLVYFVCVHLTEQIPFGKHCSPG